MKKKQKASKDDLELAFIRLSTAKQKLHEAAIEIGRLREEGYAREWPPQITQSCATYIGLIQGIINNNETGGLNEIISVLMTELDKFYD